MYCPCITLFSNLFFKTSLILAFVCCIPSCFASLFSFGWLNSSAIFAALLLLLLLLLLLTHSLTPWTRVLIENLTGFQLYYYYYYYYYDDDKIVTVGSQIIIVLN
jgi:hypothetical protein